MFFWAALEKNLPFLLNFGFTVLVARLVSPEAYGLVAMTAILTALGQVLQNMGFTPALVQREDLTEDDTTTVFVANVAIGGLIAGLLMLFSNPIAQFFGRDEIVTVVHVNAAALFVAALGIVQNAMLQREYRFRAGLAIEVTVTLLSGAVGLTAAWAGYDLWTLLLVILVREGSRTILLWTVIRWRPRGAVSTTTLRSLWGYARHMFGASLYHNFATNLSGLLLGKFYSATALGLFGRAKSLQGMPCGLILGPLQRVVFPLYCRAQSDPVEMCRMLRGHSRSAALMAGLVTAGLATCAEEIVLVLFGQAWAEAAPMLQVLALVTFFNIVFPLHSEANKAIGASRWFFWIEVVKKTILVILVCCGMYFGITWLLWALVLSSVADYALSAVSSVRFIGYSWGSQFRDLGPALGMTALAIGLADAGAQTMTDPSALMGLLMKGGIVSAIFAAGVVVIGSRAFPEVHGVLAPLATRKLRFPPRS